ncbi:DUF6745 domain-containing protein [Micromonospora sp. NPDC004704]
MALDVERWQAAAAMRTEWAGHGFSTAPADRTTAEAAIDELYGLIGRPPPRFTWVDSPQQATELLPGSGTPIRLWEGAPPDTARPWAVAIALAALAHQLRTSMNRRVPSAPDNWWGLTPEQRLTRTRPPLEALTSGVGLDDLLDAAVRDSLRQSVNDGVRVPLRTALAPKAVEINGLGWYGQHDVHWIAHYDVRQRLGRRTFSADDIAQLDLWTAIARSCGWWWPLDGRCVLTERTAEVHTEAAPGAWHGETRTHHPRAMAIRYADGSGAYVWHGTPVPEWVINEPTVERILAERNVEVRRCAIERIGWDTYIDQAGLSLVAVAADPGNPGCDLQLYDLPRQVWGAPARVLLAVNGSVERDGHRRRYGLSVPANIDDPVAAAGWSYGLSGTQYATLLRRT